MLEQELKLSVEGAFAPAFPPGRTDVARVDERPQVDLRATYYDTSDLRLMRNGVTLRCRTGEGDRPEWTVKLPLGDGVADGREEVLFEGGSRHVPKAALDLVRAFARSRDLEPVVRLRTRRRRWLLRDAAGDELAELVDDHVSVIEQGRVVERFRELEIEGRGIERRALERLAGVLEQSGASRAAQVAKPVRALGDRATASPDVPVPEPPRARDDAAAAVQAAIANGVRRVILNDSRTRLGEMEPLHQMRVGTRRLRSDLRTFRPLLDREWAESLRTELGWLGGSLGAVRDLDVLIERLRREGADLAPRLDGLLAALERRRRRARTALLADLSSPRYVELLDRLVDAANEPKLSERAQRPAATTLPPLVACSGRKLARAGRSLGPDSPDAELHRVRVLAKRARYAAEAVAPALGGDARRGATSFARRAAKVQDVLGELQDSVVAAGTIEAFAAGRSGDASLALAAGRMLERESRARSAARAAFPQAWRKLDRPKRRRWM